MTSGKRPVRPLAAEDVDRLLDGCHDDPFAVLGPHLEEGGIVTHCLMPGALSVMALTLSGKEVGTLSPIAGDERKGRIFAGRLTTRKLQPLRYRASAGDVSWIVGDAYSFGPVLGALDDYYLSEGSHYRLFDRLGAHTLSHQGCPGVHFAVWAPNARRVSVVGDFNHWDGRLHAMRRRHDTGIWEIFVPDLGPGQTYKYEVLAADGSMLPLKADPFAFAAELRPATASLTTAPLTHEWGDQAHRAHWGTVDPRTPPISIYEVHAGSWRKRQDGGFLSWDDMADQLIPYVVEMGFTHIEFMPIAEHPYDPSWGYQVTGLFAPSARFGPREGFARFVDGAHRAGLGVIIDWVPAHFPIDSHGLARFDGTALYEHEDPRQGFHPDWNTAIYNFGRREVMAFLINNALFWAETYHIDGLRVDAVASMLYLDYSRAPGEWLPNERGGNENLEAVAFLRKLNSAAYGTHPGLMMIAEESTSWPLVSHPVHHGGLGFGFKWNMGFMNDTLRYMARDPVHRRHHHQDITFGLVYAFSENFILPISHDEVVHGKGSMLNKMPGDDWQKFAQLRAYYAFMWGYPGKKLLFMGQEFAQRREWSESRPLDWDLLGHDTHAGMQRLIRDLNRIYRSRPALHRDDCAQSGFEWLVADDAQNSVFAWLRKAPSMRTVAVIANFTPIPRTNYRLRLPRAGRWTEIFNSDATIYGGSGMGNLGEITTAEDGSADVTVPSSATIILEAEP